MMYHLSRCIGCWLLLWLTTGLNAQPVTPADYHLNAYTLHDAALGDVRYYVSSEGLQTKKPLLVLLDGSGHWPLALLVKEPRRLEVMNTFDRDMMALADRFHLVLISKPGVPFCDTIQVNKDTVTMDDVDRLLPMPYIYRHKNGLQWRAQAASKVIDAVCARFPVDQSRVVVYGYSEGAQVAPKVAQLNKKVTHCASIFGSGLNQLYDFIHDARLEAVKGHISYAAAQQRIDSLLRLFEDIYQHPQDTRQEWENNTYQRWAGYGAEPPLQQFSQLNIPLFVVAGMHDANSPVYSLDYLPLEFLRLGKKNLTYKVYPVNHFFQNTANPRDTANYKSRMISNLLQWLKMP
ncbi:alpha/beta hydrolase family protein [Chitinophaga qingshengii]|uniref:Alpha/beta hydrolase n=1 Tax=Chitinophaga qingshengii TaxID=1569794 RepID=A0ABR7THJ4_9BACT|nr:hypothetical protein [Chitinophaga qingshengii]MBC9928859.1 hypothetical protein [Chitinophaga qingshengii]